MVLALIVCLIIVKKYIVRLHSADTIVIVRTTQSLAEYKQRIDAIIDANVAKHHEFGDSKTQLSQACHHALQGGKRLRSAIMWNIVDSLNRRYHRNIDPQYTAMFLEYVHNASLVIDDLPEFDDDSVRRSKLSVHTKYGKGVAQMAAVSLVAAAFNNINRQVKWLRRYCPRVFRNKLADIGMQLCDQMSEALGVHGAAGGQYMDALTQRQLNLEFPSMEESPSQIRERYIAMMKMKTGALFEVSFGAGWVVGGGKDKDLALVRRIGMAFGLAFQMADDIADYHQKNERYNYAQQFGLDQTRHMVAVSLEQIMKDLKSLRLWSPFWNEAFHILSRVD